MDILFIILYLFLKIQSLISTNKSVLEFCLRVDKVEPKSLISRVLV